MADGLENTPLLPGEASTELGPMRLRDHDGGTFIRPVHDMTVVRLAVANILVLEDNALISIDLEDMLRDLGAGAVSVTRSVDEALDVIRGGEISAAIIDVVIGDGHSASVAEALLQRQIPFVVSSGYGEEKLSQDQFLGRARLAKPFTSDDLVDALRSAGIIIG